MYACMYVVCMYVRTYVCLDNVVRISHVCMCYYVYVCEFRGPAMGIVSRLRADGTMCFGVCCVRPSNFDNPHTSFGTLHPQSSKAPFALDLKNMHQICQLP